jgi:hypothetical protein
MLERGVHPFGLLELVDDDIRGVLDLCFLQSAN